MSDTSISRASSNSYANVIGTGPNKVEKPIAEKIVDKVKDVAHKITDSAKEVTKSAEGKAMVGGLAMTPFLPVVGPAIAIGGVAAAALKFLRGTPKNDSSSQAPLAEAAKSVGKAAAKAGMVAATTVAGAALGPVGAVAGAAAGMAAVNGGIAKAGAQLGKAAAKAAEEVGKGANKAKELSFVDKAIIVGAASAVTPLAPIGIAGAAAAIAIDKIKNHK